MLRHKMMYALSLIMLITFTSCDVINKIGNQFGQATKKPDSMGNIVRNQPGLRGDQQKQNNTEGDPEQPQYKIITAVYKEKDIKISYPRLENMIENEKMSIINDILKNEAIKIAKDQKQENEKPKMEINYDIKFKGKNLLSVVYTGKSDKEGALYKKNLFYTTNINLKDAIRLTLSDFIILNEGFVEKLKKAEYKPYDSDGQVHKDKVKEEIEKKDLLKELERTDNIREENVSNFYSYIKPDALGISIGVTHSSGDHAEYEIKYDDIKEFIREETKILEEVLNKQSQK